MLRGAVSRVWLCLSCCLLLRSAHPAGNVGPAGPFLTFPLEGDSGEPIPEDWEWGSGSSLLHLLHADSPFVTEAPGRQVNCTQRFWLPPSSPVCWEDIAGPKEFAESRLLVLQNRAALQAVSTSSGVEEGGVSYDLQARQEMLGIRSDHRNMGETMQIMETVFVSLGEKRKEGKKQGLMTSMKEQVSSTRDAIAFRAHLAGHLEEQLSSLENTLLNIQLRLTKLIPQ